MDVSVAQQSIHWIKIKRGQLIVAIEYFLKSARDLDFILVEANGLSDPSQLI